MAGPWANGAELKDAIIRKADREDLRPQIDEFVRLAEKRIQNDIDLRFVETVATGTFDGTTDVLTLPTDCVEPRHFWLTSPRWEVAIVAPGQFLALQSQQEGEPYPLGCMSEGLTLRFTSTPAEDAPYELGYLAELGALEDDTSNWLLQNGPHALLYGGLCELATEIHDATLYAGWDQLYGYHVGRLRRREWRAKAGAGGTLKVRSRRPTP